MIVVTVGVDMLRDYPRSVFKVDSSGLTFLKKIRYIFVFFVRIVFKKFFVLGAVRQDNINGFHLILVRTVCLHIGKLRLG